MTIMKLTGSVAVLFYAMAALPNASAKVGKPVKAKKPAKKKTYGQTKFPPSYEVHLPKRAGKHPVIEAAEQISTRIVGGTEVDGPGRYPFYVSWDGSCGGSLIHSDIVLTAAHCDVIDANSVVINAYELDFDPYSGTSIVVTTTEGTIQRKIVERSMHPFYDDESAANDFLLLKLEEPIIDIQPIPINSSPTSPATGEDLKIVGLGVTSGDDAAFQPDFLREVVVSAVSDDSCDAAYSNFGGIVEDVMFCASAPGKDSCQGDSGGPIFTFDASGEPKAQVGVVSWGIGCADASFPGVYSEISAAKGWIDSEICRLSNDKPSTCGSGNDNEVGNGNEVEVVVSIFTDDYPSETSWKVTNSVGSVVGSVDVGTYKTGGKIFQHSVQIIKGTEYTFEINDAVGDGVCCGEFGNGTYEVTYGSNVLASGGEFEDSESTTFTVPSQPPRDICEDSTEEFLVDSLQDMQTCVWLADNMVRFGYLCTFFDVALACPSTCDVCDLL